MSVINNPAEQAAKAPAYDTNSVTVRGIVTEAPELEHTMPDGHSFYRMQVSTARASGTQDRLPAIISGERLPEGIHPGCRIELDGQIRTYNLPQPVDGRRLRVVMFAQEARMCAQDQDENEVHLTGIICRAPILRMTPKGRVICDFLLGVKWGQDKYAYVPCIAWSKNASMVSLMSMGDRIELRGRIQSREYVKRFPDGSETTRTAYEVSAVWISSI